MHNTRRRRSFRYRYCYPTHSRVTMMRGLVRLFGLVGLVGFGLVGIEHPE